MILHCQGMGVAFERKFKMEVMGYRPSPLFTLSIASVHSCQSSFFSVYWKGLWLWKRDQEMMLAVVVAGLFQDLVQNQ